jgi:hypothetical protein
VRRLPDPATRAVPHRVGAVDWPPTFAAGPYGGPHRAVVLAAKTHHRTRRRPRPRGGHGGDPPAAGRRGAGRLIRGWSRCSSCRPRRVRRRPGGGAAVWSLGACRAAARFVDGSAGGTVRVGEVCRLAEGARDSVGLGRVAAPGEHLSAALRFDSADAGRRQASWDGPHRCDGGGRRRRRQHHRGDGAAVQSGVRGQGAASRRRRGRGRRLIGAGTPCEGRGWPRGDPSGGGAEVGRERAPDVRSGYYGGDNEATGS